MRSKDDHGVSASKMRSFSNYFSRQLQDATDISDFDDTRCSMTSEMWFKVAAEIRKKNFIYRGEGNDSVVIALPKLSKVLRVKKSPSDYIADTQRSGHLRLLQKICYTKEVMLPLLGNAFIDIPDLICIPAPILSTISTLIESLRPAERKHKKIDVHSAHALLMSDACLFNNHHSNTDNPTFAVEVKPKHGFLPMMMNMDDDHKHRRNRMKLRSTCRYSVKQACKLKKKAINVKSEYCPVDLFSGCPKRMKRALLGLLQNPQNNLRIFKNGRRIYSQGSTIDELEYIKIQPTGNRISPPKHRVTDWLCDLIIKALCFNAHYDQQHILPKEYYPSEYCQGHSSHHKENPSNFCTNCQHSLPSGSVLDKILAIQRMDTLDISGIYPLYIKTRKILREIKVSNFLEHEVNYSNAIRYAINKVNEFLIAATAKDCSIIIKFQQITNNLSKQVYSNQGCFLLHDMDGSCLQVSVKVVDLDPKSPDRIEKYYKKDREMAENYLS